MLLLALAAATLGPARLPPVDQCASDKSFVEYRSALRRTIARRDVPGLLAMVSDDIHASLGGHIGKKDFIELWRLRQPQSSKIWNELGTALRLGCSLTNGVPTAPSFQDQMGGDRDVLDTRIALPGAVLRTRPTDRSPVVARLQWHVLTQRTPWDGGSWVAVKLNDGRRGFVRHTMARSPIDYRAWFDKRGGRWQMAGFLAGD